MSLGLPVSSLGLLLEFSILESKSMFATKVTAKGVRRASYKVTLYNEIISAWKESNKKVPNSMKKTNLWNVIEELSKPLFSALRARGLNNQKGKSFLFQNLFPNARCPNCNASVSVSPFCGRLCYREYTTGYAWHTQDPNNIKHMADALEKRTGYRNVSQIPAIKKKKENSAIKNFGGVGFQSETIKESFKKTMLSRTGYDHQMKNPEFLKAFEDRCEERTGFRNPSQDPRIKALKEQTYFEKTGYTSPSQNPAVQARNRETYFEKTGYDHPWRNPEVLARRKATLLERTGYDNPLANPETFLKAMSTMHRVKSATYKKRHYSFQGYEDVVFEKLVIKHGSRNVSTQFDKNFIPCYNEVGWWPDLYVKSINTWVEVKSTYTLWGTKTQQTLKANKNKAKSCVESNTNVRWVVVTNHKDKKCVVLPKDWYLMTRNQIIKYVEEGQQ